MNLYDKTCKKKHKILAKISSTIKHYNLIAKGDKILIGVSGGPDSVCLLYILNSLKKDLGISLHIAHLNHLLRGKESDKDSEFVLELAHRLGTPATLKAVNVKKLADKSSLEEAARTERLHFLFETAKKIKADKIALGHNKDDQSETILMRLLRGSGTLGLSGILPKRKIEGWTVIRPLIETERKTIEGFLTSNKIPYRKDSSNLKTIYFRNRLRHKLLPLLAQYNPNIKEILSNTAQSLALDYDYLLSQSLKAYRDAAVPTKVNPSQHRHCEEPAPLHQATKQSRFSAFVLTNYGGSAEVPKHVGGKNEKQFFVGTAHCAVPTVRYASCIKLKKEKLLILHPALQNMVLRLAFEALKGDTRQLNFQHNKEILDLIHNRPFNSIVDLPSGISACLKKKHLFIYKR